ncbi:MAG: ABC transporter C-terminal domain-containing protein [Planctomycetota bacterium]|jgi:hypothetical protein
MNRFFALAACAALTFSGMLSADEEIADLQARIASLEAKMMAPAASGDAESLMSLRKRGQVKIGGKVELNMFHLKRDEVNLGNHQNVDGTTLAQGISGYSLDSVALGDGITGHAGQNIRGGDTFNYDTYSWEGNLTFSVDINADTKAIIDFDLEEDAISDLVEDIYIEFNKVRGSNWKITLGKTSMPFGQAYTPSISTPFIDEGTLVMNDYSRTNDRNAISDPHTAVGIDIDNANGAATNVFGIIAEYSWKNNLTLEMATYMDGKDANSTAGQSQDMFGDKSDPLFATYTARLTWTPNEAFTGSVSFMNEHESAGGFSEWAAAGATGLRAARTADTNGADNLENSRALSVAFTYDCKPLKTEFFGEYVANWNMGWEENDADIFQLGGAYSFSPKIKLTGWWEMMHVDNNEMAARYGNRVMNGAAGAGGNTVNAHNNAFSANAASAVELRRLYNSAFDEDAQRLGLAAEYTTDSGISFRAEYIYEWYQNDLSWYDDVYGQQIAFQTIYNF